MSEPRVAQCAHREQGADGPASALVIALVAFNLRPALSAIGPVLPEIMRQTGLSATGASLLTTLPILCLGLFGAAGPVLARWLGMERAVAALLLALVAGLLLRGVPTTTTLFAGSLLAGAAIGLGNVLMPAVLKRRPARPALMTGLYTMALCLGAAIGAAIAVPLAQRFGSWSIALAGWAAPAALALAAVGWTWRAQLGRRRPGAAARRRASAGGGGLLRDPLAWQVTLFMGLQSMMAYAMFGWLAPILRTRGDSAHVAGMVVAVSILSQVGASLGAPLLAVRLRGQGGLAAAVVALIVASMFGLIRLPLQWQWLFSVCLGIGMGAAFAIAITLIVLRSPDTDTAARLSGMAQSLGYTIASLGPLVIGVWHDRAGDWHGAEALFLLAGLGAAIAGFLAGRPRLVGGARLATAG